jgi:autotransporter-associated beta strand protein
VSLILLAGTSLHAQVTWTQPGGGNWNVNSNWSSGTFPNAAGAAAVLGTNIAANAAIPLFQDITLGSLTFNDDNNYSVNNDNLIFNSGGPGAATILVTNSGGNGAHTIASALQLTSNLVVSQWSSGLFTMSGSKSGAGGITKEGTGTLTLSGAATYLGATAVNNGTVIYRSATAIPGGPVTIGDGVGAAASAFLTISNAIPTAGALAATINSDGVLLQGQNIITRVQSLAGTGEVRLTSVGSGQSFEFAMGTNNATFNGTITGGVANGTTPNPAGGGRINKSGLGTQTLSGSNSYITRTFISDGALNATHSNAFGSAALTNGTYTYDNGAVAVSGNISLAEPLFLNGQGRGEGALRSVSGSNAITGSISIGWTGVTNVATNASLGAATNSTLVIASQITATNAAIGLTKYGAGTVIFATNNTYTGSTVVNAGTLRLAAASNALAGNLQIQTNATVTLGASEQIADTAAITNAGGTLSMGSFNETVASVTMSGGILQGAGTLTAASYSLTAGTADVNLGSGSLNKTTADVATIAAGRTVSVTNATISAGTMVVNGTLAGPTTVTNAGTIAGTGSVSTLNITTAAPFRPVIRPGPSPRPMARPGRRVAPTIGKSSASWTTPARVGTCLM